MMPAILLEALGMFLLLGAVILLCYRKVPMGQAHIRIGPGEPKVITCGGYFKFPLLHHVDVVPLNTIVMEITQDKWVVGPANETLTAIISLHVVNERQAILKVARLIPGANPGEIRNIIKDRIKMFLGGIRNVHSTNLSEQMEKVDDELTPFGLRQVALTLKEGEKIIYSTGPYR